LNTIVYTCFSQKEKPEFRFYAEKFLQGNQKLLPVHFYIKAMAEI
jgi:hypothetical protein